MEGANYDVRFTGRAADSNISVRSMSRLGEKPTQSLTVSQALAAAYSSMNITKEPEVIQKNERPKPWLKYQKSYMAPGKLRQKLISLKSISKGLEFKLVNKILFHLRTIFKSFQRSKARCSGQNRTEIGASNGDNTTEAI